MLIIKIITIKQKNHKIHKNQWKTNIFHRIQAERVCLLGILVIILLYKLRISFIFIFERKMLMFWRLVKYYIILCSYYSYSVCI